MSNRIMNLILTKKHEALCKSIEDQNVRELVEKNSIVTGGCIASMLLKEEIHDFDFYFMNFETCKAVAEYYVNQFIKEHDNLRIKPQVVIEDETTGHVYDLDGKHLNPKEDDDDDLKVYPFDINNELRVRIRIQSAGIVGDKTNDVEYQYFENRPLNEGEEYVDQALESPIDTLEKQDTISGEDVQKSSALGSLRGAGTEKGKYRPVFLTDNAITLSDKTQLVIRFYGDAEKIHENFDYIHCTNYWRSDTKELVLKKEALEALLAKRLYYVNSKYPICALVRIRKFMRRGYSIDAGQILKMCFQISKLDLNNIAVLNDQLLGMDQAYFQQLINYIQQEKAKNENWVLDLPYLASVIDRIF